MSILLAVTTDGRGEYLERTVASIHDRLTGNITGRLIWDDSGDTEYHAWLHETFRPAGWRVRGGGRVGHARARHDMWNHIAQWRGSFTHIAGWEDDFVLTRPVNLDDLAAILDANPHLSQVALLRNACYPRELREPDRILGWHPKRFRQRAGYYQHRLFWTCNPSLYRFELCVEGWPAVEGSEKVFHDTQVAKHRWSAFYGRVGDPPAIEHIGAQRAGGWY